MRTFDQMHDDCNRAGHPCGYWGENGAWLVVAGRHRDSDSVEESNFRSMLRDLGGEGEFVAVERENHWAVGWVEHLLLHPDATELVAKAEEWREGLEDYPVYDEEDWSKLEWDSFHEYAASELKQYDNWYDALRFMMEGPCNTVVGDESSEWEVIERTREELEARDNGEENILPIKSTLSESLTGNLFSGAR